MAQALHAMVIGVLQVELTIDWARSLKDKRRVVRSLRDRLSRDFGVSVAEIGLHDQHRTAALGIVLAAGNVPDCQSRLDIINNQIQMHRECVVSNHSTEIITG